ncbi:MAG: sugar ABC transporter ATP-binding protein [Candidatus Saccharimonadales bacterium]
MSTAIATRNLSKQFGSNIVLRDINLEVQPGTLHSLVGENGAGKSTLLNIIHGVYQEYGGQLELFGEPVRLKSPHHAIESGISKVHQEVHISRGQTVGENIALGSEPGRFGFINRRVLYSEIDQILDRLGCTFRSVDVAGGLTVGQIQMMAIAKSLFHQAKVISFDEPTASLSDRETEVLFRVINDLRAEGITMLYVSHRLDEVMDLSDQISILRDGVLMGTWNRGELTKAGMIERMVGRELDDALAHPTRLSAGEHPVALTVENLSGQGFNDVSFEVRKGEILGFAGLVGAGRTEVVETIFGARPIKGGAIAIDGEPATISSPIDAMRQGIALIPEDRKRDGFIRNLDNEMNMFLPLFEKKRYWMVNKPRIRSNFDRFGEAMNLHPRDPKYATVQLSGGNQQKVVLGKWLGTDPEILILDEPTKGIDVGAKAEIYRLIQGLAAEGRAIIVVSSELPELLSLSTRILVMHQGRVTAVLPNDGLDEKTVLHHAMGGES